MGWNKKEMARRKKKRKMAMLGSDIRKQVSDHLLGVYPNWSEVSVLGKTLNKCNAKGSYQYHSYAWSSTL